VRKMIVVLVASGLSLVGAGAALANGPDPAGPAKYGLCTAYAHNSDQAKQHGVAFQNLEQAASDANQSVEDYCSNATPGGK